MNQSTNFGTWTHEYVLNRWWLSRVYPNIEEMKWRCQHWTSMREHSMSVLHFSHRNSPCRQHNLTWFQSTHNTQNQQWKRLNYLFLQIYLINSHLIGRTIRKMIDGQNLWTRRTSWHINIINIRINCNTISCSFWHRAGHVFLAARILYSKL